MIPCRNTCPRYQEGCHKTCAQWAEIRSAFQKEQREKKLWLKSHNEISSTILRQYRLMNPLRSHHF